MTDETNDPVQAAQAKDRLVGALVGEWSALGELIHGLSAAQWEAATPLPGWRVRDVVAHMVGTEASLAGDPQPEAAQGVAERPHVRNEIAAANEIWVAALGDVSTADLVERFDEVTGRRAASLDAMTPEEFHAPSWTPAGQGTYARFMQIRVFDCWMHELDIRDGLRLGDPGDSDPDPRWLAAAQVAGDELEGALGYVIGKLVGAPAGAAISLQLTGPGGRTVTVEVNGRAAVVPGPTRPATLTATLPFTLFARLAGGRTRADDHLDSIHLEGDLELGDRLVHNLAYTI